MTATLALPNVWGAERVDEGLTKETVMLPVGSAPQPVGFPHFPSLLHAFVWRNWTLVPVKKMGATLRGTPQVIQELAASMGLPKQGRIGREQQRRSYITIIRRNWHLLPYEQLLELLDWTAEHMAYMLREDDFLFIKLGSLKPKCAPLRYRRPDEAAVKRAQEIAAVTRSIQSEESAEGKEPLFSFVSDLSEKQGTRLSNRAPKKEEKAEPRFCYSYFALYGDPLLEPDLDPYPEGYLKRLAALGVNGVWLQGVLQKLAPLPWIAENDEERRQRLKNLRTLAKRAARHGIGIYLYLNEPRAMPQAFFAKRPELKGAPAGDHASVCTSVAAVRDALRGAVAHIVETVPELAGFFTITASENPTNCWSHGAGGKCPRCGDRGAEIVIAEVNATFQDGIDQARLAVKTKARLIAWDWGWNDAWAEGIIARLPREVTLQSVSEWSIPIKRGGVNSSVGEYSISVVGPGPRATRHWELAQKRGMRTIAKIQASNTWELSATPYIPALENVARHVAQLSSARVDGLMLGWTLGGYPSPNLEVACTLAVEGTDAGPVEERVQRALKRVAVTRFGPELAPDVVIAWNAFSAAFSEYPYHVEVVYKGPMQYGPANLLWAEKTGYNATMVGFPYDDLKAWRNVYPPEIFIRQFGKVADGFDKAILQLRAAVASIVAAENKVKKRFRRELDREIDVARAAAIHFRSTANQARFVQLRDEATEKATQGGANEMRKILREELELAAELRAIQMRDSRIGFEATNHYFYVPQDLLEKVINCRWLLEQFSS